MEIRKLNASMNIVLKSRDSSVGIALDYGMDDRGSKIRDPEGDGNFSFTNASRTALEPI
jgi:hypothetical protein